MTSQAWTLTLTDTFALTGPGEDRPKALPRKHKAMLAVLALLAPEPVPRAKLGAILWPEASVKHRQVSLRQALAHLKKVCPGSPFLKADRVSLSLDLTTLRLDQGEGRLLDFREPWFGLWRVSPLAARNAALDDEGPKEDESAVRAFELLLDWTIKTQPNSGFGLIHHALEIALSLPPPRALTLARELLRAGDLAHPLRGYANLLHSYALFFCNETEAAGEGFSRLRESAQAKRDADLLVFAAFYEFGCVLPSGDLRSARAIVARLAHIPTESLSTKAVCRLVHAQGLSAAAGGDYKTGFRSLTKAMDLAQTYGQGYELAYVSANCAWMAASVMENDVANKAYRTYTDLSRHDHWQFEATIALARIHLLSSEGRTAEALALGQDFLVHLQKRGIVTFEIYARESLARVHALSGQGEAARTELAEARRLREQVNWGILPWDRDRISLVTGIST